MGDLYQPRAPHDVRGGWKAEKSQGWKVAAGAVAAAVVPLALALRAVTR